MDNRRIVKGARVTYEYDLTPPYNHFGTVVERTGDSAVVAWDSSDSVPEAFPVSRLRELQFVFSASCENLHHCGTWEQYSMKHVHNAYKGCRMSVISGRPEEGHACQYQVGRRPDASKPNKIVYQPYNG